MKVKKKSTQVPLTCYYLLSNTTHQPALPSLNNALTNRYRNSSLDKVQSGF